MTDTAPRAPVESPHPLAVAPGGRTIDLPWETVCTATCRIPTDADPHQSLRTNEAGSQLDTRHLPAYVVSEGDLSAPTDGRSGLAMVGTLGEGGMGVVSAARQLSLAREVAVKRPRHDVHSGDPNGQLLREALVTGALDHPNIVPVYDLGQDSRGDPLLLMKRVAGSSWLDLLRQRPGASGDGMLRWLGEQLDIFAHVCNAVRFAHSQGIVHRDLKPENVMVGEYGEVYVLDWGVAVSLDERAAARFPLARDCRHIAGTPAYMAPEQVTADPVLLGVRTDIYLLGAVLHQVLTGHAPHEADSALASLYAAYVSRPPDLGPDVPPTLARICRTAMARDPAARYADAAQLQAEVRAWRAHLASTQLTRTAEGLLRRYRERLNASTGAEGGGTRFDPRENVRLLTECRFGFMQALEVWPDNQAACDGLQEIGVLAVRAALAEGDEKLAAMWMADLPRPDPELAAQLATLRAEREKRRQELDRLQQVGRRFDVSAGWGTRQKLAAALALIWTCKPLVLGTLQHTGVATPGYAQQHAGAVLFLVVVVAAGWLGRRAWAATAINRALYTVLVGLAVVSGAGRLIMQAAGLNIEQTLTVDMLAFALAAVAASAVTSDRWLLPLCAVYMAAAGLAAWWPAGAFFVLGGAHAVALGTLVVLWRPGRAGRVALR